MDETRTRRVSGSCFNCENDGYLLRQRWASREFTRISENLWKLKKKETLKAKDKR